MFTPLITHDSDGTALAAPVDAARRNGATYKTRTIDDLRIKDDRLRAAIEGTGHLLFDGGMGTMLQAAGMKAGALPELLNFEEPQVITDIQRQYVEAGCDVITANTFGANAHKLDGAATVADVFAAAVACAREAGARYVAGDIGPIGALLRPLGTLSFDEAYDLFAEEVRAGVAAGVDLFIIETMTDLAEIKAAVLACRENSDLPVFATMTFEEDGRTFLGTSPEVAAITLDAIGADVLGINCSQGPAELRGLAARMLTVTNKPVMVQANAGLPHVDDDGNTVFDIQAPEYAEAVAGMIEDGVSVVGGCCGTTPAHMAALRTLIDNHTPSPRRRKPSMSVTSAQTVVDLPCDGHKIAVIGERINPTGKKKLQAALREGDTGYVLNEAFKQEEAGAHILDVNVGLPGLDEPAVLTKMVEAIQEVTGLPLQLDTSNPEAMERALRRYNGKPLINSVNGKEESLNAILPLVKKYGGGLVCLALDDNGIPATAEGRVAIAEKIIARAEALGIPRRELLVDGLTMPVSAGGDNAKVTLATLAGAKKLGVKTALGVSNVSFGLPKRDHLNQAFFTMALYQGLDGAIINPMSAAMMGAFKSYRALLGLDDQCQEYMTYMENLKEAAPAPAKAAPAAAPAEGSAPAAPPKAENTLNYSVCKGLKEAAATQAKELAEGGREILDIINGELVPALDEVGKAFEKGKLFLPQLLMSAEAAKEAFQVLKEYLPATESHGAPQIVLATVKGDIHDIGKNIVKVLLESYRFRVLDLGKDVPPEAIVEAVRAQKIPLVGLSALMTTTAPYMKETIQALHEAGLECKVVVGGAVITQDYADEIKADRYAADAMETVHYAQEVLGG